MSCQIPQVPEHCFSMGRFQPKTFETPFRRCQSQHLKKKKQHIRTSTFPKMLYVLSPSWVDLTTSGGLNFTKAKVPNTLLRPEYTII